MKPWIKRLSISAAAVLILGAAAAVGLDALDRAYPPPLDEAPALAAEVVDRDGALLRAFATPDGAWRFRIRLDEVDPQFVEMLLAYEDRRFRGHFGVDPMALGRAAWQFATHGRIVSGGSTITMQLARLIEPREARSLSAKLLQIARALQIERRLSKDEILERYLTLAPYGGNLEGIRAATLAWYGKEPRRLGLGEAALLVALPQSPERRRPDRNAGAAEAGRDRVLERMVAAGVLGEREAARARGDGVPDRRRPMPALAAHAAEAALRSAPSLPRQQLTVSRRAQEGLEAVAREAARKLGPRLSVAMVLADAGTGEILGEVGSADFFDAARSGWVDMTRVVRSPGSTLKSFIYGLAFEEGLVAQETIIEDRPASFGGYRPRNFDMAYQGDVSIRQALQLSLNVPAVRLLDAIGPARLASRFRQAGVHATLPKGEAPGLAIALGGVGLTLRDLVQLYTAFPNGGRAVAISDRKTAERKTAVLDPAAAWQIADILSGVVPPEGARRRGIAYKTGTSYGYRDAWSVGFDGRYVLGVWVGRPDGSAVPGLSGYVSAAPILFEAFERSGLGTVPLPRPPAGAVRLARADLPVTQRRFSSSRDDLSAGKVAEPAPAIVFPPDGARVELASDDAAPLVLKLQGGRAPFRWLANGRPLSEVSRRRTMRWQPEGGGFSTLTVIDAAGRAASVKVFVER
ncbi:penicillin-binding protein 1C [Aquamicrobium sp. LC103]|uniref:penicillin-binding protein 1C n=1 Tax=Aquamicrobium sp. LC103 TaxID=1120658 RepID=UPI00063E7BBD|nr:penicillin-binding protein 1C [Aquamicrobium sp. LC103]TKT80238.1 penicillin-binding protein 1C [Aquamicrobium sp. LC103]